MGNCSGKKSTNIQNPSKKPDPEISGSKFIRKDSFNFEDGSRTGDLVRMRQPDDRRAEQLKSEDEADGGEILR